MTEYQKDVIDNWTKYPVRMCRSLHHCALCRLEIKDGQQYYDGGYSRRAHIECVAKSQKTFEAAMETNNG